MAVSEVSICNLALAKIGASLIEALTDNNKAAKYAALFHEPMRDETLAAHAWGFAAKRQSLALVSDTAVGKWSYTYQIPVDCLKPRFIEDPTGMGRHDTPFRIEGDKLLCTETTPTLVYTARVENPALFSVPFRKALVARLSAELAIPLSNQKSLAETMMKVYQQVIFDAALEDVRSDTDESPQRDDPWITARG